MVKALTVIFAAGLGDTAAVWESVAQPLGALEALDFARSHPETIRGIVLVDPRLPGFTVRCKAANLRGCGVRRYCA